MERLNGCHNRPPLRATVIVQDGYFYPADRERIARLVELPDPMTKDCQHTLGAPNDPGCKGCIHQSEGVPI